jgi:hypothetical protein
MGVCLCSSNPIDDSAELVLLHVLSDKSLSDAERHVAEVEYVDDIVSSIDTSGVLQTGGDPRARRRRRLTHHSELAGRFRETQ